MATPAPAPAASEAATTGDSAGSTHHNWRHRAYVSELPSDFLRPDGAAPETVVVGSAERWQQEELDRQAALALQRHYSARTVPVQTAAGRLHLTIAQAKLTKNYGLTRMDPYVRLRLGHCVYETQTCYNGATSPRWNKTVMCYVPVGVSSMQLEIYDECSFTDDQLIAQSTIQIPEQVLTGGATSDDWYPLSGRQGDGKEGMINLIMNYAPMSAVQQQQGGGPMGVPLLMPQPMLGMLPAMAVPVYPSQPVPAGQVAPQQPPPPQQPGPPPPIQPETVAQLKEMFPALDEEIIRSVLVSSGGDQSAAIASLLELSS